MLILITEQAELGQGLAARLRDNGVFSFVCPLALGKTLCDEKDTGGVWIDCTADRRSAERLCRALRQSYPELPIAVWAAEKAILDLPADRILRSPDPEALWEDLLDFCFRDCGWEKGPLQTYYLTLGNGPEETYYMGYPLPLSPRGWQILRCLFYRAPELTSSADLLALCYPEGGSARNLTVQIHHINQAAQKIHPSPLIVNRYGKGYRLRDGIL